MINYHLKYNNGELIEYFFLLISVTAYLLRPQRTPVMMDEFYFTFFLSIVSLLVYFYYKKKKNYFDFDTLFITMCYLIGFLATFFYNQYYYRSLFLRFEFDEEYINSASWLFLIGIQSYFCGSLKKNKFGSTMKNPVRIHTFLLKIAIFIMVCLFIALGGFSFYKSMYDDSSEGGSSLVPYLVLGIIVFSLNLIVAEFYNKLTYKHYKIDVYSFCLIFFLSIVLLLAGNRTAASQLLLPILGMYTFLFKPIKLRLFLCFIPIAILFMWVIQNIRANNDVEFKTATPVLMALDLTLPSRTTYVALEYVNIYGYTYGRSMSSGIIGILPGVASLFKDDIRERSSAELLSDYTNNALKIPEVQRIGLGTTIISDIYLSFGWFGVVILMYLLGHFINYHEKNAHHNFFSMIIIASMLANSVFLVRASYTHFFRYVIWTLLIAYFMEKNSSLARGNNIE